MSSIEHRKRLAERKGPPTIPTSFRPMKPRQPAQAVTEQLPGPGIDFEQATRDLAAEQAAWEALKNPDLGMAHIASTPHDTPNPLLAAFEDSVKVPPPPVSLQPILVNPQTMEDLKKFGETQQPVVVDHPSHTSPCGSEGIEEVSPTPAVDGEPIDGVMPHEEPDELIGEEPKPVAGTDADE